ncbi:uncharacterized protein LOC113004598 [Solenopsis invicta]|uniref:uncharacterized protein LOC113004598 n=1 Tax=Solenopsis invicta TaxID=13686 RepID=UPI00193D5F1C|nr:uncharacterized protein LOC113004598 [Solenopsis invicta]
MTELLAKQQTLLHSIANALSNFKKLGRNNYTPAKIRSRINALKDAWGQCVNAHAALMHVTPEDQKKGVEYFALQQFDEHEELFRTALDYMTECLEELEPVSPAASLASPTFRYADPASSSVSHLPPIKIPPFSGKPEDWESFRDRFSSLIIQNKELTAFSRMHFLASSLTGSALDAIKTVPVTADNFDIAWKILLSRYDNKRRLVDVHIAALLNLPSVNRESAAELNDLRDKANRAIASLKKLNRSSEEILNDILVHTVSRRLDSSTRKAWKLKGSEDATIPTFEDLDKFLAARARALEELSPSSSTTSTSRAKGSQVTASTASTISCPLCNASHYVNKCAQFLNRSPSQRVEVVKQAKRCLNCLSTKHATQSCPSKYSCRTCQKRHHTLLHVDPGSVSAVTAIAPNASTLSETTEVSTAISMSAACDFQSRPPVFLATAQILVTSPLGRTRTVRALLDPGSELTLISERLSRELKLRRLRLPVSISGVGCVDAGSCRYAAKFEISSIHSPEPAFSVIATIMRSLTPYSPSRAASQGSWSHLDGLSLADSDPTSAAPIEVIIGADLYGEILLDGRRKGEFGQPYAQNTIFGWVLSGPTSSSPFLSSASVHCCSQVTCSRGDSPTLDQALRRFWEVEEIPRKVVLTPDELQCEEHFLKTHSRCSDGRYIVRLPFKNGPPIKIGSSRGTAARYLSSLLRRFQKSPDLQKEYSEFLREYEEMGHMRESPPLSESSQCVFIPHHPVIRDGSSTTRLRVIFNASSITSNATSLNDHMLAGPKLQTELTAVILRWCQFRYVYSADIAKMYRQILVDPRDVNYQRILWCKNDSSCPREYKLLTVTYGTAAAPFLALRILRQLLYDEGPAFPLAMSVLQDNIYVDDVLFGADDIPLLRQTRDQTCAVLGRGGFQLRKWSSNSSRLLDDIPEENHGLACSKTLQEDEQLKILGISWSPSQDAFQFRVSVPSSIPRTKRSILSVIARLFDPLGWSAPVTIRAKIFLQKLWQIRVDWDEDINASLGDEWLSIENSLKAIDGLLIDRWIRKGADTVMCEVHGFSDASQKAYAAAVYSHLASLSDERSSMLLLSKSKVAPIKPWSVPRLELAAAVLLSRLVEFTLESLRLPDTTPCYCWTDSTVVLAWVTQHLSQWRTFVSNRIADIQTRLPNAAWRHVSTDDNPADCASRGILGSQLASHDLWWSGPSWLRLASSDWPSPIAPTPAGELPEQRSEKTVNLVGQLEPWDLASRYSSWPKLLRVTAYILRFVSRNAHLRSLHAGTQLTLNVMRQEFWLLRGRSVVRAAIHKCVVCARERAAIPTQLMGNLPQVRVSPPSRAFLSCGLDYAGPILIRSMSGRGIASRKAYIVIFICMATRAAHLEIVDGYATPTFLAAYARFVARRGLPKSIYSDNGTTFVGADREMTIAFRAALRNSDFLNRTATDNTS